MLRPYAAPASRQLTERRTGLLFTKRRLFLILPIFAVISFLAPANLQQHLRRLADKCIHNVCEYHYALIVMIVYHIPTDNKH